MPRDLFKTVMNTNFRLVAPPPTRRTSIGGWPKVASYIRLGERLRSCITERKSEQFLSRLTFFVIVRSRYASSSCSYNVYGRTDVINYIVSLSFMHKW